MSGEQHLARATSCVDAGRLHAGLPAAPANRLVNLVAAAAMTFTVLVATLGAFLPVVAHAASTTGTNAATQDAAPSLELTASRVVPGKDGAAEQKLPADQARTGDSIEYVATYRNPTPATLHHVIVEIPVPAPAAQYQLDTARPRADAASTDGKHFAALPLTRTQTLANGQQVTKPAPAADYHVLRWDLGDVPAGATRAVSARVLVGGGAAAAAPATPP